jgi:hypothetical protein
MEEDRMSKYKALHALATQPPAQPGGQSSKNHYRQGRKEMDSLVTQRNGSEWDDEDEDDMQDVLDRFVDTYAGEEAGGRALGRSRSFEAIKKRLPGRASESFYEDDESEEDRYEERASMESFGPGDRNSLWDESIYSHTGVLDPEESEEARERFIKRVEAMCRDDSGGRRHGVPPVPRIPDSFFGNGVPPPGRNWNKF